MVTIARPLNRWASEPCILVGLKGLLLLALAKPFPLDRTRPEVVLSFGAVGTVQQSPIFLDDMAP